MFNEGMTTNPYRTEVARLTKIGADTNRIAAIAAQAEMFDAWSAIFEQAAKIAA